MSEKENITKTDLLSNLRTQKPKQQEKIVILYIINFQHDDNMDDNIWNEVSDEEEEHQVTKISNKFTSNLLVKEET